jgi:amino-acid N-acetyltransferase
VRLREERLVSELAPAGAVELRRLGDGEISAARALLAACELPVDDLANPAISLIGAFHGHDLVGVIGLEACESVGLLRSLAVAGGHRGRGVARDLCDHLFALATERGIETLFLLTTTAADYFARLGFVAIDRDAAPGSIQTTTQFASICPTSARVMRRVCAGSQ